MPFFSLSLILCLCLSFLSFSLILFQLKSLFLFSFLQFAYRKTFSGRFWIGIEAKKIGLIDGFGNPNTVARDIIGAAELVEYEVKQSILSKLGGSFAGSLRDMLIRAHIL